MGEAGPEAVMPLSRGSDGKLGVKAQGGGTVVNVINNAGAETRTEEKQRGDGGMNIDVYIEKKVESYIAGGGADSVFGSSFGARRVGR